MSVKKQSFGLHYSTDAISIQMINSASAIGRNFVVETSIDRH